MTITIKSEKINEYYIEIRQEKFETSYKVGLYKESGDYYRTENEHYYPTLKKAQTRYNCLKRTINEGR